LSVLILAQRGENMELCRLASGLDDDMWALGKQRVLELHRILRLHCRAVMTSAST
jgi:hypothetical protein